MKLGVFDSGLGGLLLTKSIRDYMPDLDLVYFGDTLHVPYGNRSQDAIYTYTLRSIQFLFEQDCKLIILACNTASAAALRRIQQEWMPARYPDRRVLGVVVPTLETTLEQGHRDIGLLATRYVVESKVYEIELQKINPGIRLRALAAPLLVPMIENDGMDLIEAALERYLDQFVALPPQSLILGCTHYGLIVGTIRKYLPDTEIVAQEDIIPAKLADYLSRHPEVANMLTRRGEAEFYVSDLTQSYENAAADLFGKRIRLQQRAHPLHEAA